jgi:hypothetical protein
VGMFKKTLRKSLPKPVKQARRAVYKTTHPVTTARRAVTPRPVKQATRAVHQVTHPVEAVESALADAMWPSFGTSATRKRTTQQSVNAAPERIGGWPKRFTNEWFRANVPAMSHEDALFSALVAELRRRGWSESEIDTRVSPYYYGSL